MLLGHYVCSKLRHRAVKERNFTHCKCNFPSTDQVQSGVMSRGFSCLRYKNGLRSRATGIAKAIAAHS